MNRIYRTVWSETRQCFVVAAENSKARGKGRSLKPLAAAVISALGFLAAGEIMAADITVPGTCASPCATTIVLNASDNLEVQAGAAVAVATTSPGVQISGGRVAGSITNSGTISAYEHGIAIYGAGATNISNSGLIEQAGGPTSGAGIYLGTNSTISGIITNSGMISGSLYAIGVQAGSLISGGLVNSGTLTGQDGIYLDGSGRIGGIANLGAGATISGSHGAGIYLSQSTIAGNLSNTGRIAGTEAGVLLDRSTITGALINGGTISATGSTASLGAIKLENNSVIQAGITNTGSIIGPNGIFLSYSSLSGGIHNSGGTITATVNINGIAPVRVEYSTVNNGISNSGLIDGGGLNAVKGISVISSLINGGITNSGNIVVNHTGIDVGGTSSTVNGGIVNASGGTISGRWGIAVGGSATVVGNISNSGVIDVLYYGIELDGANITQSVVNSGQIDAGIGIVHSDGSIAGSIVNSGTINASRTGIYLESSTVGGSISNAGTISAADVGIYLSSASVVGAIVNETNKRISVQATASGTGIRAAASNVSAGIINHGTISASAHGTSAHAWGVLIEDGASIGGGITNTGLITATATTTGFVETALGIQINSSTVTGGIFNDGGTISASAAGGTAISVYGSGSTLTGGITNSGLISGPLGIGIGGTGSTVSGGVLNQSGGRIVGTGGVAIAVALGNELDSVTNASGGTINGAMYLFSTATNVTNNGLWIMPNDTSFGSNISGNFVQGSTGTLRIGAAGMNPGEYSQIVVGGSATLGGTLDIDVKTVNTIAAGTLDNVITATGGITGTFASITDNSTLFDFTGVYNANDFDLSITAAGGGGGGGGGLTEQIVVAQGNTPAVGAARALDSIFASDPTGPLATVFVPLTTDRQVSQAVSQTLPLLVGGSQIAATAALTGINRVIQARIESNRGLSSGEHFYGDQKFWMKPFGSWAEQGDRKGVSGFDTNVAGAAFGADAIISPATRLGLSFAYAKAGVDGNSKIAPNKANVDVYQFVGYGSHALDQDREINFQVGIGQNRNRGKRDLLTWGLRAESDYKSLTATVGVGYGQTFRLNEKTGFTPSIRADYSWIKDDGYTEKGAGVLNLDVKRRTTDELILAVDGKLTHEPVKGIMLSANLGIGYDLLNGQASITSAYAGSPTVGFTTKGLDPSPWMVRGGLGVATNIQPGIEISARYDVEHRSDFLNQTGSVKVRWAF